MKSTLFTKISLFFVLTFAIYYAIFYHWGLKAQQDQLLENSHRIIEEFAENQASLLDMLFSSYETLGINSAEFVASQLSKEPPDDYEAQFFRDYIFQNNAFRSVKQLPYTSGAFISALAAPDEPLKKELLLSSIGFDEYAKGALNTVFNMYYISQKGFLRIYKNDWAFSVEAEHDFSKDVFYSVAIPKNNPEKKPIWTTPYYDSIWKKWMISLITPVYINDEFKGVVGHDVIIDSIYDIVVKKLFFSGYVFIFDSSRNIIVHPNTKKNFDPQKAMGTLIDSRNAAGKELAETLENLKISDNKSLYVHFSNKHTAQCMFIHRMKILDWYLAVVVPHSDIVNMLIPFQKKFSAVFFGIAFTVLCMLLFLTWVILVKPLKKISYASGEIGTGNFDYRLHHNSSDEIGKLSRDINTMAENLATLHKKLIISEQELIEYADCMQTLNARLSVDGVIQWVNSAVSRAAGIPKSELLGKHISDTYGWNYDPHIQQQLNTAIQTAANGESVHYNAKFRTMDNCFVNISFNLVPIFHNGVVSYLVAEGRNITDLVEAQQHLQEQEENLRITLDSIDNAVIATNPENHITRMNPVAETLTGWKKKNALGKKLEDIFHILDTAGQTINNTTAYILEQKHRQGISSQILLRSQNNAEYYIEISGAPIRNQSGEILGNVFVFSDVTEKNLMEERLRHTRKMESIGQLAGGIAHDFNNMLGGILGSADLIHYITRDPEIKSLSETIIEASQRASDLTQKLLSFSRKGKIVSAPLDVHRTIQDAVNILERSIDKKISVSLVLNAQESTIIGDFSQIQNALLNLGINARDAMPEGGTIVFETQNVCLTRDFLKTTTFNAFQGNYIQVSVSDTGHGIPKNLINKIFEPFFTTKPTGSGTGLGLSAVYGTVKEHSGIVTVDSTEGHGACFTLYFPISSVITDEPFPEEKQEKIFSGTVLIVDDEDIVRNIISKMLEKIGFTVFSASNSSEACDILKNTSVSFILIDMVMPQDDGEATFYKLKNMKNDLKVILCSGFSLNTKVEELLSKNSENIIGFLKKPYRISDITDMIKKLF